MSRDRGGFGAEWYRLHKDGGVRLRNLQARSKALSKIRAFFEERGFLEIEAPLLVRSPGLELHLTPFQVGSDRYLITSPEYQMKRLLVSGLSKIYSLGKVFRQGEAGPMHNPEFTLLEWYRAEEGDGWQEVAKDVEDLCAYLAEALTGSPVLSVPGGRSVNLLPPWPRLSVAEAMERYAGVRLRGDETLDELASKLGISAPEGAGWDDLFFQVFLDKVEPHLGQPLPGSSSVQPVVLTDWPVPLCALARKKPGHEQVVERFEAYVLGLELCNGFGELCDEVEQRARFAADLAERKRRGFPLYPMDERFLAALKEGMPPAGGVALGVDRLLMLLLSAKHIAEVLPFTEGEL